MTGQRTSLASTMRIDIAPDGSAITGDSQTIPVEGHVGEACELIGSPDFRELLHHVYDAALITTMAGQIIRSNPRASQFFRYPEETLTGFHICDLISGASSDLVETICTTLENQRFILIEAHCYRADSSLFPAEIAVNALHISDGNYMCFFVRDISHRRAQEEELRTGNNALQNAECVIGVCDLDGTVSYQNPALPKLLATQDQVDTLLWEHLADPSQAGEISAELLNRHPWSGELKLMRSDAQLITVQATFAPNINSDGDITGMVFSFVDVTTQKQAQEELLRQSTLIREDLQLAQEFQQAMLRQAIPSFPPSADIDESAICFGQLYLPSSAVGGDFVEVLQLADDKAGIFIADVMGHGVRSALIVATVRGLVEEIAPRANDPGDFLTQLNADLSAIFEKSGQTAFVTALFATIDLRTGCTQLASAGHPRPIRVSRSRKVVEKIDFQNEAIRGPALGLIPDIDYAIDTLQLDPDDVLLLYTDGLSEAENPNGTPFNSPRMQAALEPYIDASPGDMLDKLVDAGCLFCQSDSFTDDVCLVAAHLKRLIRDDELHPVLPAS
jgi:PAS domain S-box-containing protein